MEYERVNPSKCVKCIHFPCNDINKNCHLIPNIEINPEKIKVFMISEALPIDPNDYFYAKGSPFYLQTTIQAFNDAGYDAINMKDILDLGVYITTAVKCAKTGYSISSNTVKNCSIILEKEMDLFPAIEVLLLMGDNAIKALNYLSKRRTGIRTIPNISTYKIRKNEFFYDKMRVFPSYLQTGKNYLIEKSKRKMIAEDINSALKHQ